MNRQRIGYLLIGFTAGFYFAINLDQAYYFSIQHKIFKPLREEINKSEYSISSIYSTIKKGIQDAYDDI